MSPAPAPTGCVVWVDELTITSCPCYQHYAAWNSLSHLMTKPTKWHVCPAKTQISLGICPVWSESSLCTQWVAKDPRFLHADWVDAQADLGLRWAHMPFCWFCHEAAQFKKEYQRRSLPVSHITRKPVFGDTRTDRTQTGLLSYRS